MEITPALQAFQAKFCIMIVAQQNPALPPRVEALSMRMLAAQAGCQILTSTVAALAAFQGPPETIKPVVPEAERVHAPQAGAARKARQLIVASKTQLSFKTRFIKDR